MLCGLFGTALFYGDSVITPAISVLSVVEGLEVGNERLAPFVIPITLVVLAALFLFQKIGTARIVAWFGPVMVSWFVSRAALGVLNIVHAPEVLAALDPRHIVGFFQANPKLAFLSLGAVVLAVTGAEALYADMGHFGRRPIQLAWFGLVLPSLVLNYFGQGALLLRNPAAVDNPFYLLGPGWALHPLVLLATAATVIASQAVISGAYSIAQQATQLGFAPRVDIQHTSREEIGQIYLPGLNWLLLIGILRDEATGRVPGTAVFLTQNPRKVPTALLHSLKHYKSLHERIAILTVVSENFPHIDPEALVEVERIDERCYIIRVHYGFMDKPNLPAALRGCARFGLEFDLMETSFFLGRETVIPKLGAGMAMWRQKIFLALYRNAGSAVAYFQLPPNRVVELGTQVVL